MTPGHRRIVSTIALGSFMVATATGLVFSVPPMTVLWRAVAASAGLILLSTIVVLIIERLWTK